MPIMARTGPVRTDPSGWVYAITNPAWPGFFKIGKAARLRRRLGSYQTGAPYKDYQIWDAIRVPDRHLAERSAHEYLTEYRIDNEWFRCTPTTVTSAFAHVQRQMGARIQ